MKFQQSDKIRTRMTKIKGQSVKFDTIKINGAGLDEVKIYLKKYADKIFLKYPTAQIFTTIKYEGMGWKSKKSITANYDGNIPIYDPMEIYRNWTRRPNIQSVMISMMERPAGGADTDKNDCLFFVISHALEGQIPFKSPATLKRKLGLNRRDMISLDKIQEVEKLIELCIDITGDAEMNSTAAYPRKITIEFKNNHFTIGRSQERKQIFNELFKSIHEDLPIVMYRHNFEEERTDYYDGKTKFSHHFDEHYAYMKSQTGLLFVDMDNVQLFKNKGKYFTLEQAYYNHISIATTLKQLTNGLINLFRSASFKNCVLTALFNTTKSINPEEISAEEHKFLEFATTGALMYQLTADTNNTHYYDINSNYPHSLTLMSIPTTQGEFRTVGADFLETMRTEWTETYKTPTFILRCKITNPNTSYLFRHNPTNYYTNYDIQLAFNLGLEINIIEDKQPNLLIYNTTTKGGDIFKKLVSVLYELKERKIDGVKELLSILWGGLCQKHYDEYYDDDNISSGDLHSITPLNQSQTRCKTKMVDPNHAYKTRYARLKPFLLSYCRRKFSKIIQKIPIADIVRIHTDGIHLNTLHHDVFNPSSKIGCFKYEFVVQQKEEQTTN